MAKYRYRANDSQIGGLATGALIHCSGDHAETQWVTAIEATGAWIPLVVRRSERVLHLQQVVGRGCEEFAPRRRVSHCVTFG